MEDPPVFGMWKKFNALVTVQLILKALYHFFKLFLQVIYDLIICPCAFQGTLLLPIADNADSAPAALYELTAK